MMYRYDSNGSIREPVLQKAFILAVDRSRLVSQRNKGRALDCHYAEYSLHYNLCNQLATRIKESLVSASSAGYVQLQQQFNLQFNNPSSQQAYLSPSGNSGGAESRLNPVERLRIASEALHLSEYGMKEAISDDMESIGAESSDWETVCSSENEDVASFDSIPPSTDSGRKYEGILV